MRPGLESQTLVLVASASRSFAAIVASSFAASATSEQTTQLALQSAKASTEASATTTEASAANVSARITAVSATTVAAWIARIAARRSSLNRYRNLLFNASWNANGYRVRNLLANLLALANRFGFADFSADRVRNLTSFGFADVSSCANRDLLRLGFANPTGYAVVFNSRSWLANNSSRAVVNNFGAWLADKTSNAVVDNFGAWLADVLGSCARNLLADSLASVLRAANFFGFASRNPNFAADRTIGGLAANGLAAARNESSASGARITGPSASSANSLRVSAARNDFRASFKVSTANGNLLRFRVRNANRAVNVLHVRFGNGLANVVSNGSLLHFLDGTTLVGRDFFLVILFDAAPNGVVDRSLLHLFYRTLDRVGAGLVGRFANRSTNLVGFRSVLCFANHSSDWNFNVFKDVLVNRSVTSLLLLLHHCSADGLHDRVATAVADCWGS
jgi:hypothetical protein